MRVTGIAVVSSDAGVLFHARAASRLDLGTTDWTTLGLIDRLGPMTHGDLVGQLGLKPALVTNILDRLERSSWIHRSRVFDDGRRVKVSVNKEKLAASRDTLFRSLSENLAREYEGYSNDQLVLIAQILEEIAKAQTAAADDI